MNGWGLSESDFEDVKLRAEIVRALGTPAQRKAARRSLGLSLRDVGEITGLAIDSIRLRESKDWQHTRGSLDSPKGWAYVQLIATARGYRLERTSRTASPSGGSARAPTSETVAA